MASARSIEAGRAFMRLFLDDDEFRRGLLKTQRSVQEFGRTLQGVGLGLAGVGAAIVAPFTLAVKSASAAQESLSRFQQVFGQQAQAAEQFAQTLASSVGRSVTQIRDGMSSLQGLFQGLGFDSVQSRQFSEQLQALAIDFASFNNISDDEAIGRFISAMSGSSEVLDRFGVNIKASALNQEFLARGMDVTTATASEQEKAIARLAIITRSLDRNGVTGDAIRTADSFSNQMKSLRAEIQNVSEAIGAILIPRLVPFLQGMREVVVAIGDFAARNETLVVALAGSGAAYLAAGLSIAAFGKALVVATGGMKQLIFLAPRLNAALLLLSRNPYALAIAAVGVAVLGLIKAWQALTTPINKATEATDKFIKKQKEIPAPKDASPASQVTAEDVAKLKANQTKLQSEIERTVQQRIENQIRLTSEGFEEERRLLKARLDAELESIGFYSVAARRLRREKIEAHEEEMKLIQQREEAERRAIEERAAAVTRSLEDDVARLRVELNFDGPDETRELLELDRQRALRDAETDKDRALINEQFDLRQRLTEEGGREFQDRIRSTLQNLPIGGLATDRAGQVFGARDFQTRLLRTEETTAKGVQRLVQLAERGGGVVGI